MRYRGFEITSCYDTGIERYNQQTGEDEICSGYFCEIYPAGDDQYANQLDAFCLAEGHEIADTTQGSLENGIIRYVDGHYGYLQEEKEEAPKQPKAVVSQSLTGRPTRAAANKKKVRLRKGDAVEHTIYGQGVVLEIRGDVATIAFGHTIGVKKLNASHPSLKKA